jgi:hypothetical protein
VVGCKPIGLVGGVQRLLCPAFMEMELVSETSFDFELPDVSASPRKLY